MWGVYTQSMLLVVAGNVSTESTNGVAGDSGLFGTNTLKVSACAFLSALGRMLQNTFSACICTCSSCHLFKDMYLVARNEQYVVLGLHYPWVWQL